MIGRTNNGGGGASVVSIAVTHAPTKTSYKDGENLNLTGMIVTATMSDGTTETVTDYTTVPANGSVLHEGTTSVTISYSGCIATQAITVSPAVVVKPFATATDAEIVAMAQALQNGTLTTSELGWSQGNTRTVSMGSSLGTQTLVIYHVGSAGIKFTDGTDVHVIIGFKDIVKSGQAYGSNNTYSSSNLKTQETAIYNALPSSIKPAFKEFNAYTAANGNATSATPYAVYMCSPAEKEVFGSRTNSVSAEANALTQFDYFKTSNNRIKKSGGSAAAWWERSPTSGTTSGACVVNSYGTAYGYGVDNTLGVSPFGCI